MTSQSTAVKPVPKPVSKVGCNTRATMRPSDAVQPNNRLLGALRRALLGAEAESACGTAPALQVEVRCAKCGEVIRARVDKMHELQCEYGDSGVGEPDQEPHPISYVLTKELVGARCQNLVHLSVRFDSRSRLIEKHIEGGEFSLVEGCE
jgi:hypothetical protein